MKYANAFFFCFVVWQQEINAGSNLIGAWIIVICYYFARWVCLPSAATAAAAAAAPIGAARRIGKVKRMLSYSLTDEYEWNTAIGNENRGQRTVKQKHG